MSKRQTETNPLFGDTKLVDLQRQQAKERADLRARQQQQIVQYRQDKVKRRADYESEFGGGVDLSLVFLGLLVVGGGYLAATGKLKVQS